MASAMPLEAAQNAASAAEDHTDLNFFVHRETGSQ
jgi:hypothetical protein